MELNKIKFMIVAYSIFIFAGISVIISFFALLITKNTSSIEGRWFMIMYPAAFISLTLCQILRIRFE